MGDNNNDLLITDEVIISKIYTIRGRQVMLARDLAELYEVEIKVLNQQVKRNIRKFPERYMFQLTKNEHDRLRSQFVTLKRGQHVKYLPYAFTEHDGQIRVIFEYLKQLEKAKHEALERQPPVVKGYEREM